MTLIILMSFIGRGSEVGGDGGAEEFESLGVVGCEGAEVGAVDVEYSPYLVFFEEGDNNFRA